MWCVRMSAYCSVVCYSVCVGLLLVFLHGCFAAVLWCHLCMCLCVHIYMFVLYVCAVCGVCEHAGLRVFL